jgi:hypothetical protein
MQDERHNRVVTHAWRALPLALAGLLGGCAGYPAMDHGFAQVAVHDAGTHLAVVFSDGDRRAIRDYYAALPRPARARHGHNPHDPGALPPGIAKQVARGKGLPPGIAKQRLPGALERRLSPLPDGYLRVRIGADVVLMDARTQVVLDLVRDIG